MPMIQLFIVSYYGNQHLHSYVTLGLLVGYSVGIPLPNFSKVRYSPVLYIKSKSKLPW